MIRLWLLLSLSLLFACEKTPPPARLTVVDTFEVGRDVFVRALAADPARDRLWVGTSVGALGVRLSDSTVAETITRANGLANEYVFAIHVDAAGRTWFGSNGGGVARRSVEGQWRSYFPMHGLADYWVYSFAESANGDLWIGTWAGLNRLAADGTFTTYLKELVNEWVYGLVVDDKQRLWVATEGGVNMYDGERWRVWTHADGLGAANVEGRPFSPNTGLGTRSRHDLNVLVEGRDSYNPNYVFGLALAANGDIWAGTWGGGASRFDGKRWHNYSRRDGLAGDIVYSLLEDGQGAMWFGTDKGLSRFKDGQWLHLDQTSGLLDNHVYALTLDDGGDIWAGTRHGVVRVRLQSPA